MDLDELVCQADEERSESLERLLVLIPRTRGETRREVALQALVLMDLEEASGERCGWSRDLHADLAVTLCAALASEADPELEASMHDAGVGCGARGRAAHGPPRGPGSR